MGIFSSKTNINVESYVGLELATVLKALKARNVAINIVALKDDDVYQHSPMNKSVITVVYDVTSGVVTQLYVD